MTASRRILVVGLKEQDAGKTTLTRAILSFLNGKNGSRACGFKPRAGNSLWYDYDVVSESLSQGRLYGSDAKLLRSASGSEVPEEVHNPVHRLWSVSSSTSYGAEASSGLPRFVVDRVAYGYDGGRSHVTAVLNARHSVSTADEGLLRRFLNSCDDVRVVSTPGELAANVPLYDMAAEVSHRILEEMYDMMVYESYADVALPWSGIRSLDAVFAVEPGRVRSYDPSRYIKACELTAPVRGQEASTAAVCRLINRGKVVDIPPKRSDTILPALIEKVPELLENTNSG